MIEKHFDVPFIANMAMREKQIQQNYRPIIAVHKWFARRPGTLFRGLILSEFASEDLRTAYYKSHRLKNLHIADPFMGGGTPLIEANRLGCDVTGYDINPMAYWIVRQEIERLDLPAYTRAATELRERLERHIGSLYRTQCIKCGSADAHAKYFLWVKTQDCVQCGRTFDLFPGYLLAENKRHPANVLVCPACSELNEVNDREAPGLCRLCSGALSLKGPATRNRCVCPHCGTENTYPTPNQGAPQHRMFALEYYCPSCKVSHQGRFFKKPEQEDLDKYESASILLSDLEPHCIPEDEIPAGDETDRLLRWGYRRYREMFNERQLLGLELSGRIILEQEDGRVRNALATNLSDLLRYQNMLCRYDTMALKSLDVFSVHGFPVGLVQCESNLLGVENGSEDTNVGSGGWLNIVAKYTRAKEYCERPFEVVDVGRQKRRLFIKGESIGDGPGVEGGRARSVSLHCASSTTADLAPASVDAVFTDPPYFANVQYAELMDFCYVWLRRLASDPSGAFARSSTRSENELTGNATMGRDLAYFTEGLAQVFRQMADALKPGHPLVFTYHHNTIEGYLPVAVALLDTGLACSASLPCPAEMGASIHISGTGSSIVDTVFVCRSTGVVSRRLVGRTAEEVAAMVRHDVASLDAGDVRLTLGDVRCIAFGHLVRLAIWHLRQSWDRRLPMEDKLRLVAKRVDDLGGWPALESLLSTQGSWSPTREPALLREQQTDYETEGDEIPF